MVFMKWYDRLEKLIGYDEVNLLKEKRVLILGIGGVGGYACESLVRSGIGHIYIIDYDKIDITNINRQVIALHSTIGLYKVDVMKERMLDINPSLDIRISKEFIDENNLKTQLSNIDFVVDACDTLKTKLELIKLCKKLNIPFISCMGTGNKMDPSRLKIVDIRKTSYDPLAKLVRKFVKEEKINGKVMVVCSDEEKYVSHTSIIPSNSFVPATAGLLLASYVIRKLIK